MRTCGCIKPDWVHPTYQNGTLFLESKGYHFEIGECIALKVKEIFHGITRNQGRDQGLKTKYLSEMNKVVSVYFAWIFFFSNSSHFSAGLGTNNIKYGSEVQLYINSATVKTFLWCNRKVLIKKLCW